MLERLEKLYNWIQKKVENTSLDCYPSDFDTPLELSALDAAIIEIKKKKATLLRNERIRYYNKVEIKTSGQDGLLHDNTSGAYNDFLTFLENYREIVQKEPTSSLGVSMLNYVLFTSPEQAFLLFQHYSTVNQKAALAWYEKQKDSRLREIAEEHEKQKAFPKQLQHVESLLNQESNLSSLFPLIQKARVEDAYQLAAFVIVLLGRGVDPKSILEDLLHNFFSVEAPFFDNEANEIKNFFDLLKPYEIAKEFIVQANTSVKNFMNSLYELNSEKQPPASKIDETSPFTISAENFKNLLTLFGTPFLIHALSLLLKNKDQALKELLETSIHEMKESNLAELINQTAKNNQKGMLEFLAKFIQPEQITGLMNNHYGEVFFLVPFKEEMTKQEINLQSLSNYVKQLRQPDNLFDALANLVSLLNVFNKNRESEKFLYSEIINLTSNVYLFDDPVIALLVKKYDIIFPEVIQNKAIKLTEQLHESINKFLEENSFSDSSSFNSVHDCWTKGANQFSRLKGFQKNLSSRYPRDIYELNAEVVRRASEKQGNKFSLEACLNALVERPKEFSAEEVSQYERTLIQILVTVDDEFIRAQVLALLETTPRKNNKWIFQKYFPKCSLLEKAVIAGNLGFIQLLYDQFSDGVTGLELYWSLFKAFTHNHLDALPLIVSFAEKVGTKQLLIAIEMIKATFLGQLETVQSFYKMAEKEEPSSWTTSGVLEFAIKCGRWDIVQFLCSITTENKPNTQVVNKMLLYASCRGQTEVVRILCSITTENKPRTDTVNKALANAVTFRHTEAVKILCNMKDENKPDPEGVKKALMRAVDFDSEELLNILCNMNSENRPSSDTVNEALKIAVSNDKIKSIIFFGAMEGENAPTIYGLFNAIVLLPPPERIDVLQSIYSCSNMREPIELLNITKHQIKTAVTNGELSVVQWFCNLTGENALNDRDINEILQTALSKNKLEIVQFLCTLKSNALDSKSVSKALMDSDVCPSLDILQYLCQLESKIPNSEALSAALKHAEVSKQKTEIDFLCNLAGKNKPSSDAVVTTLEKAIKQNNIEVIQLICGIKEDHRPTESAFNNLISQAKKDKQPQILTYLEKGKGINALRNHIESLGHHGRRMKDEGADQEADKVIQLATQLTKLTDEFSASFNSSYSGRPLSEVRGEFQNILETSYGQMHGHRKKWKYILANIAVSATVIGLLWVLPEIFRTGHGLFFETKRQVKINEIKGFLKQHEGVLTLECRG